MPMNITVKDIMTSVVTCASSDYNVQQLENVMSKYQLSCLPILDSHGQCVGVVSAADLIHWHLLRKRASDGQAGEVFSQPTISVGPDIELTEAVELMVSKNAHHLIVLDGNELVGIVSVMDVLAQFLANECSSFPKHALL